MFVKTTARKTKSGTVRYLHLAHSEWDPVAGRSVPKILYGFGREDQLDRDAIKRLVGSLTRLLDPADAQAASAGAGRGVDVLRVPPVRRHRSSSTRCGDGWASTPCCAAWTPARAARRAAAGPALPR